MPEGTVIVIGGAEDKVRDRVILNRFVALAGGPDATIAVISTASSLGPEAGERYRAALHRARRWRRSGRSTSSPGRRPTTRRRPSAVRDATGVFLTGGNQLRLSSTIGGTRLADADRSSGSGPVPSSPARAPGRSAM